MEPDSIPVKSYWLDGLHDEITGMTPFAILGRFIFIIPNAAK